MFRRHHWKKIGLLIILLLMGSMLYSELYSLSSVFGAVSLNDSEKLQRVMAMYSEYRKKFTGVDEIDASAAIKLVGDPEVVFVDVRDPEEQAVSMIPGAVTSEIFLADPDRFRDQQIIVYCTIGYRSGKLAIRMVHRGIAMVNLTGGLLAWAHVGGTLVRGYKPVEQLHVYGRQWDLAPSGIETVY